MKKIFLLLFLIISLKASAQLGGITIPSGHTSAVNDLKLDESGKYLFSVSYKNVIMWDIKTGTQIYDFPSLADEIYDVAIKPNGDQV